jgi:hypothetical protein
MAGEEKKCQQQVLPEVCPVSFYPSWMFFTPLNWSHKLEDVPLLYPAVVCSIVYEGNEIKDPTDFSRINTMALIKKAQDNTFREVYTGCGRIEFGARCAVHTILATLPPSWLERAKTVITPKKKKPRVLLALYCWPKDLNPPKPRWVEELDQTIKAIKARQNTCPDFLV